MKENAIIVDYDFFAMKTNISILTDGKQEQRKASSKIEDLADELTSLAYKYNIYSIKIHAPFTAFDEIRHTIERSEMNTYSNNKIKVEGI